MMKKLISVFCVIILLFSFAACNKHEDLSLSDNDISNLFDTEEQISDLPFGLDGNNTDIQFSDTFEIKWIVDGYENADPEEIVEIRYSGDKIHLTAEYTFHGEGSRELGVFATLSGVRQNISVTKDGKKSSETPMYIFTARNNVTEILDVEFTPNIGNKGDILELELSDMLYPEYLVETADPAEGYNNVFIGYDTYNLKVILDADSEKEEKICTDYSNIKVSDVDPLIIANCNRMNFDGTYYNIFDDNLNAFLYKESIEEIIHPGEEGVCYFDKEVENIKNQPMIINLSGIPGKYRVAFYMNHILQPVFDDCCYVDVTVEKNKQTEVSFNIDTTVLGQYNHCYYTIYKIQDEYELANVILRSDAEKFIVNK